MRVGHALVHNDTATVYNATDFRLKARPAAGQRVPMLLLLR